MPEWEWGWKTAYNQHKLGQATIKKYFCFPLPDPQFWKWVGR